MIRIKTIKNENNITSLYEKTFNNKTQRLKDDKSSPITLSYISKYSSKVFGYMFIASMRHLDRAVESPFRTIYNSFGNYKQCIKVFFPSVKFLVSIKNKTVVYDRIMKRIGKKKVFI